MTILLLIAALATFAAWLAGICATQQGKAPNFQGHSSQVINSLSMVYLGREVIKKQLLFSNSELMHALECLLQLVINNQPGANYIEVSSCVSLREKPWHVGIRARLNRYSCAVVG